MKKNYSVYGQEFDSLDEAIAKAKTLSSDGRIMQITTTLLEGIYGYAGYAVVVKSFRGGIDLSIYESMPFDG